MTLWIYFNFHRMNALLHRQKNTSHTIWMNENRRDIKIKCFNTEKKKNHFRLYFYSLVRFFLLFSLFVWHILLYTTFFICFYCMVSIYPLNCFSFNVRIAVAFVAVVQMAMQWCVYCGFVLLFAGNDDAILLFICNV